MKAPAGFFFHGAFRHALLLAALLPGAWWVGAPGRAGGSGSTEMT